MTAVLSPPAAPGRGTVEDDSSFPSYLTALLQLSDSALPTGAFSHSFGLESYLHTGQVRDEHTLTEWLACYLDSQLTTTDALAVRAAYGDLPALAAEIRELDVLMTAAVVPRQIREASTKMGRRLLELAAESFDCPGLAAYRALVDEDVCTGHFCIAFALAGQGLAIPLDVLLRAYLWSALTSVVQNAVRAVPLGQAAGQRVLSRCRPLVDSTARRAMTLEDRYFGAVAPGLEIAQMRHEHQRARLFMS